MMNVLTDLRDKVKDLFAALRRFQQSRRNRWLIGIGVSLVSLLFLIYVISGDWEDVVVYFREADYWRLASTFLLYPIGFLPVAFVWHMLIHELSGFNDILSNLHHYAASCIPKRIPGAFWHVVSRVALYDEHGVSGVVVVTASMIETALLILSGLALFLLSVLAGALELNVEVSWIGVLAGVVILIVLLYYWKPIATFLFKVLGQDAAPILSVDLTWQKLLQIVAMCMVAWVGGGILLYILATSLFDIPAEKIMMFIGVWAGSGAAGLMSGLLVQGMGLREATLTLLLMGYMPFSMAVAIALFFRLLLTIGEFFWSIVFLGISRHFIRVTRKDY